MRPKEVTIASLNRRIEHRKAMAQAEAEGRTCVTCAHRLLIRAPGVAPRETCGRTDGAFWPVSHERGAASEALCGAEGRHWKFDPRQASSTNRTGE